MINSCQCFTMPSSHLVSVSVDHIQLCLHGLDPDNNHHGNSDVLGWCQDIDDKQASKRQPNAGKSDKRRQQQPQIRNNQIQSIYVSNGKNTTRQVNIPFSHHADLSSYMKEYTLYESFTSSYGLYPKGRAGQQILASTCNNIPPGRQMSNEKLTVSEVYKPGFAYLHGSSPRNIPERYYDQHEAAPSKAQDPRLYNSEPGKPSSKVDTNEQQQQQRESRFIERQDAAEVQTQGYVSQERQTKRHKRTKRSLTMKGGLDLGVRKRAAATNGTLEEYYAKQVEKEMIETIQEAREALRTSFKADQSSNGVADLAPAVLKLDTKGENWPEKDSVADETEDQEMGYPATKVEQRELTSGRDPMTGDSEQKASEFIKLPELGKDYCCLRTKRSVKKRHRATKQNSKMAFQSGSRETEPVSSVVRTVRGQTKHTPLESGDSNAEVRHSMPSLASLYTTSDVPVSPASPSKVVLPKLHKWLSDTALNDWFNDRAAVAAFKANSHTFSREFLEYANKLKNKDIFIMLHELQRQKKSSRRTPRDVHSVPNFGQENLVAKSLWPSATAGPPPNTPDIDYQSQSDNPEQCSTCRQSYNGRGCGGHPEACLAMSHMRNRYSPRKLQKAEGMHGKTLNLVEPTLTLKKRISDQINQMPIIGQKHQRSKSQDIHGMFTKMTSRQ